MNTIEAMTGLKNIQCRTSFIMLEKDVHSRLSVQEDSTNDRVS